MAPVYLQPEEYDFIEPAGCFVRAAPKEKNMKRTIALWLGLPAAAGLLAFALLPALAQTPTDASAATGKIHGTVTGEHNKSLASSGTVELSAMSGKKGDYKFKISKTGTYEGELPAGTYSARVVMQDQTGFAEYSKTDVTVMVTAGQDTQQDIDLGNLGASTSVLPLGRPLLCLPLPSREPADRFTAASSVRTGYPPRLAQ